MRRMLAIAILAACSPRPEPVQEPTYTRPVYTQRAEPRPTASRPAEVRGGPVMERESRPLREPYNAGVAETTAGSGATVSDVLAAEGATIDGADAGVPVAASEPDAGVEYEDGIPIIRTTTRAWCHGDIAAGLCWPSQAVCARESKGKRCWRVDSYACFRVSLRTSGKTTTVCSNTYGACEAIGDLFANEAETKEVGGCVIFRYDPKAKAKK